MNTFALIGLLICISSIAISLIVVIKGKRWLHFIWAVFIFSVALWGFGSYKVATAVLIESAILWWRVSYIGVILIPTLFTHFTIEFLSLKKKILYPLYILSCVFLYINLGSDLFIKRVRYVFGFYYISPPEILYSIFVVSFFALVLYCVFKFWMALKISIGIKKTQIKFFLLAAVVGFSGGAFSFLPVYQIDLYPFLNASIVVSILITTYAIFKYRFMNIRSLLSKSILYFLLVAAVTSIFAFTSFFIAETLQEKTGSYGKLLIFMFVSFVLVLVLDPLKRFLSQITNNIFYKFKIDYQSVLREISIIIAREIDLAILLIKLRTALDVGLKIKTSDILVKRSNAYSALTKSSSTKTFATDSLLIDYLQNHHDIVITDEFYLMTEDMVESDTRHRNRQVLDELERQGIEFCMPVFLEGDLKAIIILGQKQSGDVYGTEDIEFFSSLAPQVAVAIEKSQLYESIGEFNLKLQDKVNTATKKLLITNTELQDANARLLQLDKAKSEFLSIASHQLRTPTSAIKGYLSMLLEGDFGTLTDQQRKVISDLFESSSRLARLINVFLNVSRIEAGKFKLDKTLVDINGLVTNVVKELDAQARAKHISLVFASGSNMQKVMMDSDKVREVIMNLVDNSIKYSNKGEVTIKTYMEGAYVHFEIHDNGIGIREDELGTLFHKFVRGTGVAQVNTQGSGLGLYIGQRVINEHGGKIWAESEGLGKGSAFHFIIPVTAQNSS